MDQVTSRTILTLLVGTLSIVGIAVGIQLFLVLKEFRKSLPKVDKILNDISQITESISRPAQALSGLAGIVKKFVRK